MAFLDDFLPMLAYETTNTNHSNQHLPRRTQQRRVATKPVALGNCADVMPEFGRWQDVQRLFGIERGTLYLLIAEGVVKSVVLRRKGNEKGCRLFYLKSVSDYLHKLMTEQNGQTDFDPEI